MANDSKEKEENLLNAAITGAAYDTVQVYGSAAKEHLVAYSGVDNENGTTLQKSLKSIKNQKSNPENEFAIRQQKAGWAAEVKETANENAERIIRGDKTRKIRHDDLPNTPANDPLHDHVIIDENGNIMDGSGTQMKFIGASANDPSGEGNAERALKALQSKKFRKYIENDVKIEVPKDEYQKMIELATKELDSLQEQLDRAKSSGNTELVAKLQDKIDQLNKLKKNLRPSTVTRKASTNCVDHPELETAKDIAKISHRAGVEVAKTSACISGSVSIVKNMVQLYKGEEDFGEAVTNVAKDTGKAAAVGYATGFAGSALKGAMQNSKSELVRSLSKTNIPATIVSVTISTGKTLKKYISGEIDGTECMLELGEQGTGMIASAMFAAVGQAVIPIPVVGGLIGGMVGYALSSASYGILSSSLQEAKLAREQRIAIEKACEEHIKMIREYRKQINEIINNYLSESMQLFNDSFSGIKNALEIGDVDAVIDNSNRIIDAFGGNKPFETRAEFDEKMMKGIAFKL